MGSSEQRPAPWGCGAWLLDVESRRAQPLTLLHFVNEAVSLEALDTPWHAVTGLRSDDGLRALVSSSC